MSNQSNPPTKSTSQPNELKRSWIERFYEMVPGLITWLVLTSPLWLSLNLPTAMAFFILVIDIYWLYRALKTAILSLVGYRKMKSALAVDWRQKLKEEYPTEFGEIEHLFIFGSWQERGYIIETNLQAIADSDYPMDKVRVVVALEERDTEEIKAEKRAVAERFKDKFANIYITEHPDGIEGEVIGPGSNRSWAMKHLLPQLQQELDFDKTILTTLDADFVVHPRFLAGMTYKYLTTPNPQKRSFQGMFIYSNNYWQAPAAMRIIASSIALTQLSEMVESWKYVNFSSHSINLQTLIDLDFWTTDHVNDDSHLYWKAFYHFDGDYEVVPHWLPIYADTVLDDTLLKTIVNQYKQLQRWAYGVEHRPFIFQNTIEAKKIPLIRRLERLFYVMRADLVWATAAYITGFGALIALLVNPEFGETVLGRNLAFYSGLILTVAVLGLIPAIFLNYRLFPKVPDSWGRLRSFLAYFQVVLSPFVLVTFGSAPAVDAQTRLLFGKYLTYRVTRKYRETENS